MQRLVSLVVFAPLALIAPGAMPTGGAANSGSSQATTQPAGEAPLRESFDGTMVPVLQRRQYTLVVEDLSLGEGPECDRRSEVVAHYHGTLPDGTVFDSTRGKDPATFRLDNLIPGWQVGLPGMKPGGVRRLVIPPAMAYGSRDRVDRATGRVVIPADSELTFIVQLVEVRTPTPPPQPHAGLTIEDIVVGTGRECPRGATVKVHYRGTLADGTEFDSSYRRNEPIEFALSGVIRGWQEGVPGMKVGGKRRLVIPPDMAYGAAGMPPVIPPNATLTFEIELLDVK